MPGNILMQNQGINIPLISESLDECRMQMKKFGDTIRIEKVVKKKSKKERKSRKSHMVADDDDYEEAMAHRTTQQEIDDMDKFISTVIETKEA